MSDALVEALVPLTRVPGVRGALIVEADVGVPVVQELAEDVNGMAVAALVASLFRRAERASAAGGTGRLDTLQLELAEGHVIAAGGGAMIVIAVAARDAQLGLVRIEAARVAESVG
jgi:predicted regulator of Ras-like GTPase activity (Roadblock/LC7/MglB family)